MSNTKKPERRPGILIVDDEPTIARLTEIGLRQRGFNVWATSKATDALYIYKGHAAEIDVVLSDIQMPGMDGPQLLNELRQLNPEVRCCFMTGDSGRYSLPALMATGVLHVFQKPFPMEALANDLRAIIGREAVSLVKPQMAPANERD